AVEARREELQHKVRALAGQVAASRPLLKELQNARRTLERNRDNLSRELNSAAVVAANLGVSATPTAVIALLAQLEQQIGGLRAERTELDAAPTMRTLLDRLPAALGEAERQGLGGPGAGGD